MGTIIAIVIILLSIAIFYGIFQGMEKVGELAKLNRAIHLADEKTKFIEKIYEWQESENKIPSERGIDPYDVWSSLSTAKQSGKLSLEKELREQGVINEL